MFLLDVLIELYIDRRNPIWVGLVFRVKLGFRKLELSDSRIHSTSTLQEVSLSPSTTAYYTCRRGRTNQSVADVDPGSISLPLAMEAERATKMRSVVEEDGAERESNKTSEEMENILEEIQNAKEHLLSAYEAALFNRPLTEPEGVHVEMIWAVSDFTNEAGLYEEELQSSGATAATLTIHQWHAQLLQFCPYILRLTKMVMIVSADCFNKELVLVRKNFNQHLAQQQLRDLLNHVLRESNFLICIAFSAMHVAISEGLFPLISPFVSYHAFLLLLELIIKCVDSSESSEIVMETVKKKVEEGSLLGALEYESKILADNKDEWERLVDKHNEVEVVDEHTEV